jgi:predicted acetyltransferase
VPFPVSDGVVTVRRFEAARDRQAVLDGRDEESRRWLGPGSDDPAPLGCIEVDERVVGWIDVDADQPWLQPGEGNVGYCIFPDHRGRGYASRAVKLLPGAMAAQGLRWALLVIDVANGASLGVARASGAQLRPERTMARFPTSVVYGIELS